MAINGIAFLLTRRIHQPAVTYGVAFDVAVTVPALYYWFVVRAGFQRLASLIPLGLLALWRATYVAPGMGAIRPLVGAGAELAVTGFLLVRLRQGLRTAAEDSDVLERLRKIAREILPVEIAAEIVATELATFYYAFAWGAKPHIPVGTRAFGGSQRSSASVLFATVAGLILLETPVLHLIVARWNGPMAWTATCLDVYGAVWLAAVARSFSLRPVLVENGVLLIRSGMLWTLRVNLDQVAAARLAGSADCLQLPPASDPNVTVEFTGPVEAAGMYGRRKRITRVALAVDDAEEFFKTLETR